MIDESTQFGTRVAHHLREEIVVWLTTVSPEGAPQPSPVWFVWDGATAVRLFSLPDTARARNIRTNPKVSLNFAGDGRGGDIVVLSGLASLEPDAPPAHAVPEYATKYADDIVRLGLTPESFSARYSVPVAVTLTGLRGH